MVRGLTFGMLALSALTWGCTGPYTVSRELRGHGTQSLYYLYPPGSHASRRVQLSEPLPARPDAPCAAVRDESTSFSLHVRNSPFRAPAIVIRDRGMLPKSRADFESEAVTLRGLVDVCLGADKSNAFVEELWQRLPRTFADDLLARYRYDTLNRSIDLQPGMRLRFDWQAFNTPRPAAPALNGYVGAGSSYLVVARRPHDVHAGATTAPGLLTFEPFLGWTSFTIDRGDHPQVAGVVDLQGETHARKYYRLVLPDNFGETAVPASPRLSAHVVLIGANTLSELDKAQANVSNCGSVPENSTRPICTAVAGRTMVVPEVMVRINGEGVYLPVGTTLRQIIERDDRAWSNRTRLPLRRYWRGRRTAVVFVGHDEDALDLPLLKGDEFQW